MTDKHPLMRTMLDAAIDVARPRNCLTPHLPSPPENGRLIIIGAGKAAAEMGRVAEAHYAGQCELTGMIATRHGYGMPLKHLELIEAGHPTPDEASARAADRALSIAASATPDDLVLVLLSGGASAILSAPVEGMSLADKQAATKALLQGGARISESNCVRRHISRIKGGRLARACNAPMITLAISDVPGDAPENIGSGPTVGDTSTLADAKRIIDQLGISVPQSVTDALNNDANETRLPSDPAFANNKYTIVARPAAAIEAARQAALSKGFEVDVLGDDLEGEARTVAADHMAKARIALERGERKIILSGGELTVTVTGNGRGGPNQEYALASAILLDGLPGVHLLAADTDGSDGGDGATDDPAGAEVHPSTLANARKQGIDAQRFLDNNDAMTFFSRIDDLIVTGPTQTNVNDLRIVLIDPK